jgi:general L-amino acid transport system permease protein
MPRPTNPLRDARLRAVALQALVLLGVLGGAALLVRQTQANLAQRGIASGFGFLGREASFDIGESPIRYAASDSYARALGVGLANTAKVAIVGLLGATVLGFAVGLARLSRNALVGRLASAWVEALRNVPLLLQLFFWYGAITELLPGPRQALSPFPGTFLCNRGFFFPIPSSGAGGAWMLARPELQGFNFTGGASVSPELVALALGLITYTSAFIAEIVRAGVVAVPRGQGEAAAALGLGRLATLRLVMLPQAARLIVPPLTSQYLNLIKNSSLGVAVGYPELVSIANTTMNQTGQAVEGIAIVMATYLVISLALSALANGWERSRPWVVIR